MSHEALIESRIEHPLLLPKRRRHTSPSPAHSAAGLVHQPLPGALLENTSLVLMLHTQIRSEEGAEVD